MLSFVRRFKELFHWIFHLNLERAEREGIMFLTSNHLKAFTIVKHLFCLIHFTWKLETLIKKSGHCLKLREKVLQQKRLLITVFFATKLPNNPYLQSSICIDVTRVSTNEPSG